MNMKDIHNVYFIGIGGIGMSALARYFRFVGKRVSGYDKSKTPLVDELISLGIEVHFEENTTLISNEFMYYIESSEGCYVIFFYTKGISKRIY